MIYAVFLRGINISGKNKIPMKELKRILTENGYPDAVTLLNSGNIVLSADKSEVELSRHIALIIKENFCLDIPVCAVSAERLKNAVSNAPNWWHTGNKEIYDNLILTISPFTGAEIARQLGRENENIEKHRVSGNFIFWSYTLKDYRKSKWWAKTRSADIANKITVRTGNTISKVLSLCDRLKTQS